MIIEPSGAERVDYLAAKNLANRFKFHVKWYAQGGSICVRARDFADVRSEIDLQQYRPIQFQLVHARRYCLWMKNRGKGVTRMRIEPPLRAYGARM